MKKIVCMVKENRNAKIAAIAVGGVGLVAAGAYGIRRLIRHRSEA